MYTSIGSIQTCANIAIIAIDPKYSAEYVSTMRDVIPRS